MSLRLPHTWVLFASLAACSARGGVSIIPPPPTDTGVEVVSPPPPPDGGRCTPPATMCGSDCAVLATDVVHCGRCGNRCNTGQSCVSGTCMAITACSAPRMMCGTVCADLQVDPFNCGRCGTMCAAGTTCDAGRCSGGPLCAPPRTMCLGGCVDLNTDRANCGVCGLACGATESCTGGTCAPGGGCSPPRRMCGAVCTDPSSDTSNCGTCGVRCSAGQSCTGGVCMTGGAGSSRAGARCTSDTECGALMCDTSVAGGICTDRCMNGTVTSERAVCGGTGGTCLSGNEMTNSGFCTRACTPTARSEATGGCRAGYVCTGFWLQRMTADSPGCLPFCTGDAQCLAPTNRCDTRVGTCTTRAADTTRLPDGSACNPMLTETVPGEITPRNTQCRGRCFRLSSMRPTQGMCGSFINFADTTSCPDDPTALLPRAPPDEDNLGICIFRNCTRAADCGAGLICIYPETAMGMPVTTGMRICNYATTAQPTGAP